MSRFRPRTSPSGAVLAPARPVPPVQVARPSQFDRPVQPSSVVATPAEPRSNVMQRLGFWVLCGYLASGTVNEWALRLMGIKGYLSVITLVSLPVFWLTCGSTFRGLRQTIGWWWVGFLCWMLLSTPFSVWRGGTFDMLSNYVPRSYVLFFYVAALAVSFRNCRQLMHLNVATAFATLLTCVAFGSHGDDGRYMVQGGAGFLGNSNELAMVLLIGMTQFVYLFSEKNRLGKVIAIGGIALSMPYLFWTGSRGGVIGAVAYVMVLLYTTRQRVRALAVIAVLVVIGVTFAPASVLHRLTFLTGDEEVSNRSDLSAVQSRTSRVALLKRSISETISHPIWGVGPGMFPVQVMEEAKAKNEWSQALGTHNSYTQVSSECGIPAFICYLAVIIICIQLNFKTWKRFRNQAKCADITALAVALLSGSVVYAVCSFFFHMAYTGSLPLLAGQTLALYLAAKQRIEPSQARMA